MRLAIMLFVMLSAGLVASNATETATAGEPTTDATFSIDCDMTRPGIQSVCHVGQLLQTSRRVGWVLTNHTTEAIALNAVETLFVNDGQLQLDPPSIRGSANALDDNPDFDQQSVGGTGWACSPVAPSADLEPDDPTLAVSRVVCFGGQNSTPVLPGTSRNIFSVLYEVVPGALPDTANIDIEGALLARPSFLEIGSCNPVFEVAATCNGAQIVLFCERERADINANGHVSAQDLGMLAAFIGMPPPPGYDQNFDGHLTAADLGLIHMWLSTPASLCPA